tara:strand:- start:143 stop:1072 length:930 start_codon:yes stop_codon:yes gene_type:complete
MKSKIINFIFIFLLTFVPTNAMETFIELKVNNEIITNFDIRNEYNYLIALNNELKNLDKETVLKLAKESIIREKIKKAEILKYYTLNNSPEYLDTVIKNFYEKLGIKSINEFESYLKKFNIKLDEVKTKIEIEMQWNKLIGARFANQLNIDEESLKKKIDENIAKSKLTNEYELSEIVFQISNKSELIEKTNLIQESINTQGFKNTANIYSVVDSSKFGGSLGWVEEKQLSQEINEAVIKLEIGEITKPIKITNGFLILKLENKKEKKISVNKKDLLKKAIMFEENKQFTQFSVLYYKKILLNSQVSEQ